MEVAQQLFAAQGYPETTVDDIARAAGASRATFYLHFKSKAELMGSAIDAMAPMAVETYHVLDEQLADDGPQLPGRLRGWLAEWLERWTDGPRRRMPRCRPRCSSPRSKCTTCGCRRLWSTAWWGTSIACLPGARGRTRACPGAGGTRWAFARDLKKQHCAISRLNLNARRICSLSSSHCRAVRAISHYRQVGRPSPGAFHLASE